MGEAGMKTVGNCEVFGEKSPIEKLRDAIRERR
jgi:hypothetical protein